MSQPAPGSLPWITIGDRAKVLTLVAAARHEEGLLVVSRWSVGVDEIVRGVHDDFDETAIVGSARTEKQALQAFRLGRGSVDNGFEQVEIVRRFPANFGGL